ncbi:MAG TPA: RluA family pseudouridine synthase [Candidatus Paceibacterota bacterium]|nr:RluA family pseudouridine synthase [Candidatus Paceibacterota bacterium]
MKNNGWSVNLWVMEQPDIFEEINIVFENSDFLAINKPAGLLVHQIPNGSGLTLVDWLKEKYPFIATVGEDKSRPGIVHRLDRETSGIMIIAKNNETFFYLKNLFQEKKINKGYLALVAGVFENKSGTIDAPIGRIVSSTKRSTLAKKMKDLKEARTDYEVLKNFSGEAGSGFALLEVYPRTGRTNQIRVHLASIHHPIVGDALYGSKKMELPPGLKRMFLHAYFLELPLKEGKVMRLEADLPEDLKNVLVSLGGLPKQSLGLT